MKERIKNFLWVSWNWLMLSSADSTKLSATIKGSAGFTLITFVASLLHIQGISDLTDGLVNFIVAFAQALSMGVALYGAYRKVKRTAGQTNEVLNNPQI